MSAEIFAARALILGESGDKLESFLDIPWCKADLFYIQKLVFCIEAHGSVVWQEARLPTGKDLVSISTRSFEQIAGAYPDAPG
jgi:hypothetical protein